MKNETWRKFGYFMGLLILFGIGFGVGYGVGMATGIKWFVGYGTLFLENHGVDLNYTSQQIGNVISHYMGILEEGGGLFIP